MLSNTTDLGRCELRREEEKKRKHQVPVVKQAWVGGAGMAGEAQVSREGPEMEEKLVLVGMKVGLWSRGGCKK